MNWRRTRRRSSIARVVALVIWWRALELAENIMDIFCVECGSEVKPRGCIVLAVELKGFEVRIVSGAPLKTETSSGSHVEFAVHDSVLRSQPESEIAN